MTRPFYMQITEVTQGQVPDAYEATDVRREVFEELYRLRPEEGSD